MLNMNNAYTSKLNLLWWICVLFYSSFKKVCSYVCVCECLFHNNMQMLRQIKILYVRGALRGCRSIRPGGSGRPYYCILPVCVPAVLAVWWLQKKLAVWRKKLAVWRLSKKARQVQQERTQVVLSRYTTRKRASEESRTLRDSYCMEKHVWYVYAERIRI